MLLSFEAIPILALSIKILETLTELSSPTEIPLSPTLNISVSFTSTTEPDVSIASPLISINFEFSILPELKSLSIASDMLFEKVVLFT